MASIGKKSNFGFIGVGKAPTSHLPNKDFDYTVVKNVLREVNWEIRKQTQILSAHSNCSKSGTSKDTMNRFHFDNRKTGDNI